MSLTTTIKTFVFSDYVNPISSIPDFQVKLGTLNVTDVMRKVSGAIGSELLTSSGWTVTTGWGGSYPTFSHLSGTNALSNSLIAVPGYFYKITYTISRTVGSVTLTFGGLTTGGGITATGELTGIATTNANLVVTPTNDFTGNITISIKQILDIFYMSRILNIQPLNQKVQAGTDTSAFYNTYLAIIDTTADVT